MTPPDTGFLARTVHVGNVERRYVVYVPPGYDEQRAWPLLVFLHGMGECGTDGGRQTKVGLGPAIEHEPDRWPFVVVFPQKPDRQSQWAEHDALVMAVLEATTRKFRIDPIRVLLTGLSQGGAGTWALGGKHADTFAAIAPVCGYGKPEEVAPQLRRKPIWAFHGEKDPVVPVQQSKALCAAVDAAGGDAMLTLYPEIGHNSWDRAYRESALAEWLRVLPAQHPEQTDAAPLGNAIGSALLRPDRAGGLRISVATGHGSARQVETLELQSRRTDAATSDAGATWIVWRQLQRGDGAPGTPETVAVPAVEGASLFLSCLQQLVRAGVSELPPGADNGLQMQLPDSVEAIGFDLLHSPTDPRPSCLPRLIRSDDGKWTREREALRVVADRLRSRR